MNDAQGINFFSDARLKVIIQKIGNIFGRMGLFEFWSLDIARLNIMTLSFIGKLVGLPLLAYLLGSIPFGLLVTWLQTGTDIRKKGSGNIGATNVLRTAGKTAGAVVLAADLFKGALPVYLALVPVNASNVPGQIFIALTALAAFFGHLYPLYLNFKGGGKGVATALGCILMMAPFTAVIALLVFGLMICLTSRVSVGSLAAAAVLPPVIWKDSASWPLLLCALILTLFVYVRHKENLKRILNGTEAKLW